MLSIFYGGDYMYECKINSSYVFALLSALFVSLIFNLFTRNELSFDYLVIDVNDISNLMLQNKKDIIQYILIHRIKQFLLVLILIKAFGAQNIFNIFTVICGGVLGLMISVQTYYLGFKGLIILMSYIMPHYILYYTAICYAMKKRLLHSGSDENIKNLISFCIIFAFGVILECSFMTFFLKIFHQYMVT